MKATDYVRVLVVPVKSTNSNFHFFSGPEKS